jgi:enoyl-CoA hydratase/carnithine racemase
MSDLVLVDKDGGVGTLSLNRPDRHNAINDEMGRAYGQALSDLMSDDQVRVVLLRGEGRSFSSGRDTSELGRRVGGDTDVSFLRRHSAARMTQLSQPKPMVAALKGFVIGGALETALACDMRIAATDVRMALPEAKYGLVADTGGSPLTTILAGPSRAKWMLMTGDYVDADRALRWGLVDDVVAPEELDVAARDLCRRVAEIDGDLLSLIKQLVDQTYDSVIRAGLRSEFLAQIALFSRRRQANPEGAHGAG